MFADFIVHMVPPVMLSVLPSFVFLRWYYGDVYTKQQSKMDVDDAKVSQTTKTAKLTFASLSLSYAGKAHMGLLGPTYPAPGSQPLGIPGRQRCHATYRQG